jgi:NAD(P)-dependent dehydrogenase (short-subunit alcohol dehydrogenase family)
MYDGDNMNEKLKDRGIIVTGAAMGIGKATAIAASQEGAKVAICDFNDKEGKATEREINSKGGHSKFYHLDVTSENEVRDTFQIISKDLGNIYGLVNNAGIAGVSKPTHEVTLDEWNKVISVNLNGVFLCTKQAIPYMLKNKSGSIVNLSSIYGLVGAQDAPPYHASKGAVRLMTKVDALFYAKNGIRVNSVHPGFIETPMVKGFAESSGNSEAVLSALKALHPMGRLGKPEEIAAGIVFLLSDDSSFMTGSELVIDGGYTAQ